MTVRRRTATYPRALRVNQVLRQVLAEELERLADADEVPMVTVTMGSSSASARRSSSSATTWRNTWFTRSARGYVAVRRLTVTASTPRFSLFSLVPTRRPG